MRQRILWICLLIGLLWGCTPAQSPPPPTREQIITYLEKQHVQWIETGETVTVVIPTTQLFYPDSANLNPQADKILQPLTNLLQHCESTMTRVAAFTDDQGSSIRNRALSSAQAERLVAYFTKQHIDARLLYAVGGGSAYPIADNHLPTHAPWNNRIEIKFRYVVLPPLV